VDAWVTIDIFMHGEPDMTLALTQVYLETQQKKALAHEAKRRGRKSSDLVREAVDALLLGVNPTELKQLDEATRRAEADIEQMLTDLDADAKAHRRFMAEIAHLRAAAPK
jgi:hypothetical protein